MPPKTDLVSLGLALPPDEEILYCVVWSSVHDVSPYYQYDLYAEALQNAGAETFATTERGWSNLPKIVGFTGITLADATEALMLQVPVFAIWGPIIVEVTWGEYRTQNK